MSRRVFRYEHRSEPLLPWRLFLLRRVGKTLAAAAAVIAVSLLIGMLGYRLTEGMGWLDAFLNASMILGGMGPVDTLHTDAGKLFAGFYALYSGLVLVGTAGLLLAPFMHRLMHRFHLENRHTGGD
ncbi:MAG: hypothetical protein BGP23_13840 [Lysobacterales bacterium 66-474]|nr:MAG: hypothetical protein ABT18_10615 [Rhodanobacter sp. SCN 66-43]OJY84173.1 MAG: hypothetical protein BGP23_13840 [Xanthomonadales bacterium 66-474]